MYKQEESLRCIVILHFAMNVYFVRRSRIVDGVEIKKDWMGIWNQELDVREGKGDEQECQWKNI